MPTSLMQKLHLYLGLYDFWIKIQEIIILGKCFFGLTVDKWFWKMLCGGLGFLKKIISDEARLDPRTSCLEV